ncbi:hypothetical protein ACFFKH_20150 [Micromonospora marina]|uniref:hypothetical protein n=1 Tax=Micromonospora marina TaxID=307120 RepID=UPI001FC9B087|nr:hypothetical protein [Micromonospora marina]
MADALVARGRPRPTVTPPRTPPATTARPGPAPPPTGPDGNSPAADRRYGPDLSTVTTLRADLRPGGAAESYRIDAGPAALTVTGDLAGVTAGLYRLADRIRSGAEVLPAAEAGQPVTPRLGLRLTDAGSVGREADPAAFAAGDDYSLNADVVTPALLPRAPWVDTAAVARIDTQFRQFVDHAVARGYNGVVVPGFLEYVTFAGVGDGNAVYPAGDPHVDRARAMVAAFGPVFRYADEMGLRVFLLTDMLAVSPPLERYLERTVGGLAADGMPLAVLGGLVAWAGAERALTVWNDQMALLPWGVVPDPRHHRSSGHPDRGARVRGYAAGAGVILAAAGLLLSAGRRVPRPVPGYRESRSTGEEDEMTDPRYAPIGLAAAGRLVPDDEETGGGEVVGADDAAADAARAGADVDLSRADRDSDGTPVGAADAEADRKRAAGE